MLLAMYGINIPKYWEHNPLLTDNKGYTVAMFYALECHDVLE